MTTLKLMTVSAIFGLGLAGAALAGEPVSESDQTAITEMLVADGYEVRKIEREDGMLEAYAVKDGKLYEIYFDDQLKIVKQEEK